MVAISLLFVAASYMLSGAVASPQDRPFHPNGYRKKFVTCPAVDRSGAEPKDIKLKLAYLDINPGANRILVLVHGWPSLWTTYRHQIGEFGKDYRLILPEHRGFGDSQHPKDLYSSNAMFDFVNDILCMMDHAGAKSGVCVGNDFGAQVCWEAGRSRPDRFPGIFNVGIPYISASIPFSPTTSLANLNKFFSYQVYLSENATVAARELDRDPRSAIRSCAQVANSKLPETFLARNDTFLGPWRDFVRENDLDEIPFSGIMTKEVEDYMVLSYRKQGFFNTFNGYQAGNRKISHDHEVKQRNFTLPQPTFTLFPTRDPVADWVSFAKQVNSSSYLKNHHNATMATAHWPHEESPQQFNLLLRQWLGNVTFT